MIGFIESTRTHENRSASVTPALFVAPRGSESNDNATDSKPTESCSITPIPHSGPNSNNSSRSLVSEHLYDTGSSGGTTSLAPASESMFSSQVKNANHNLCDAPDIPSAGNQHDVDSKIPVIENVVDSLNLPNNQDTSDVIRTPNVYINGLPPHFPDESLYLMTREFGHVLSVRTFTRCVGEKMSGYGFVLCAVLSFSSIYDTNDTCVVMTTLTPLNGA